MERLGKYELHEKLGEGGFGRVWRALDTDLQVWRALKEPYDQSPELEAELKEARIQARLDHPGMIRILGTERLEGRFFLVTEYADGHTLRRALRAAGDLPLETCDAVLRQILEALAYAHGEGIVHLDLKPENIFVLEDGRVKIGDFGLSRAVDRDLVTVTCPRGTLHYMAPEQLEGKAGPSVDLWAVGALAYELYTGQYAIEGRTQGEIIKRVANGEVRDLAAVPESRRPFVAALLTRDPGARASAPQALELLRGAAPGDDVAATASLTRILADPPADRPAVPPPAPARRARGRRLAWLVAALAVLMGAGAFTYGAWFGVIEVPAMARLFALLEGDVPSAQPPDSFFAAPPAEQLDRAWQYADQAFYAQAYGAAQELLGATEDPELRAEARFLKGSLEARYLDRPWHAVRSLRGYLERQPDGKLGVPAQLLLAEVYMTLERPRQGLQLLDAAVREHPDHPLLVDALVLANRCEQAVAEGGLPGLQAGQNLVAAVLPNNLPSLLLSVLSFVAFLLPGMLWIAMSFHDAADQEPDRSLRSLTRPFQRIWRSKVHRALFLGFLVFQGLQFYLNQRSASSTEAELLEAVQLIKSNVGK